MIVLTADHGESFAEHEYFLEHGKLSYQACAHIPLMISQVGRLPSGRVIDYHVGLIDLPPTLMELAGIDIPRTYQGQSLLELIDTGNVSSAPARVFMESGTVVPTQLTIREGPWKLVYVRAESDRAAMTGAEVELYDLSVDPYETNNVVDQNMDRAVSMFERLEEWYVSGLRLEGQMDELELTPQELDMLRSLGYVD